MRSQRLIVFIAVLSLTLTVSIRNGEAIPAFARKYGVSCTTCHVSIPELHGFGEAFRNNGYRFPKETPELLQEKPVQLGGKPQEKLWPQKAIWPGEIPGTVPVALRIKADYRIEPQNAVKSDFLLPQEVELLSGGNLGKSVSFFVEFVLVEDAEFGGVELAYVQFHRLWGHPLLNLTVGQFEPIAVPFSHIRKITIAAYPTSDFRNGGNPFRFRDRQRGLELWGLNGGGLLYGLGLVNGNGDGAEGPSGTFDNNSAKDFYWRLSYKFGGLALTGEGGRLPPMEAWQDNSLRLGGFGYIGSAPESRFHRFGLDARFQHGDLDLFGVFMFGEDQFRAGKAMTFQAYFAEANYVFLPWVIAALRYGQTKTPEDPSAPDTQAILVNLSLSLRPNVVLRMEGEKALHSAADPSGRLRLDVAY